MTVAEARKAFEQKKISLDEYTAAVQNASRGNASRTIKRNQKGGLFVRDPEVKAFSEDKGKEYIVSINLPWSAAVALFGPKSALLPAVQAFVASEMKD